MCPQDFLEKIQYWKKLNSHHHHVSTIKTTLCPLRLCDALLVLPVLKITPLSLLRSFLEMPQESDLPLICCAETPSNVFDLGGGGGDGGGRDGVVGVVGVARRRRFAGGPGPFRRRREEDAVVVLVVGLLQEAQPALVN